MGVKGFSKILKTKKKELQSDYLAIVDLGIQDAAIPSISLGTRGIVTMDVHVTTASTDLHSGFHGGILENPIHVLSKLLHDLRDENGKITIPGFYHNVAELSEDERGKISFNFNEQDYTTITGASAGGGEKGYSPLERSWTRPTLEVNGIAGGYSGEGFKTVIPGTATAKISCRLVPNQNPDLVGKLVADYLQEKASKGCTIKVVLHPGRGKAMRTSPNSHSVQVFKSAYSEVFGRPCEFILSGGSIPIVPELADASGAEVALLGLGLSSDQIHAPNEHFGLDRITKGTLIITKAIALFAQ